MIGYTHEQYEKIRQFIFRLDKDPSFYLAWHWRNPDGSWDITMIGLLIPAIIWMICINVNPWLISLVCLSTITFSLKKPS